MSQFRVQKVTKVKGLSELSNVGSSESKKTRSAANSDRPQTQPRQKKNSVGKSTEGKTTSDSKGSVTSDKTAPPRPATRTKTSVKKSTAKTCPSQQEKKNAEPQKGSSNSKASIDGPKLPPKPGVTTKPKTASPQRPPPREQVVKNRPEIKKESSYDASCSDSDEQGSHEKLSPEGDFGYETGSYDDSDVSNNELLSPSVRNENKNLLGDTHSGNHNPGYSYAAVEFRPLIMQDDIGIAAPVETRHPGELPEGLSAVERQSYAYAGDEFRPLIITDEVGIAAPVNSRKPTSSDTDAPPVPERRWPLMSYEEVEIIGGEFDRTNANILHLRTDTSTSNENIEDSTYAEISEDTTQDNLNGREQFFGEEFNDSEAFSVDCGGDVYAVMQKPKNKSAPTPDNNTDELSSDHSPRGPINSVASSTGSLYESITGELQDLIRACDNGQGKASRVGSSEGVIETHPPPIPVPYSGAGPLALVEEGEPFVAPGAATQAGEDMPVYAAVQKKPKDKSKPKEEEIPAFEIPPPLPSRPILDDNDTLRRGISPENCSSLDDLQERLKKSGLGFLKGHRRKLSDGNIALSSENMAHYNTPGSTKKKGHRRCRSQDDISRVINDTQDLRTHMNDGVVSRDMNGSGNLVQAYLEVDITDPPQTPEEFKTTHVHPWEVDIMAEYELPDGWKEVESENGTKYYWHIASGTTQWERPQVATRPKKKSTEEQKSLARIPERQKVLSFPVHSMGWIELEENQVAPHNMSETIAECIATLAKKRNDLWNTNETWGEGKDIRLLLEGDTLKLVEPRNKLTLLVQPVSKMRVWGVGKEDHRDFAYVARDPQTSKHKCHMFRCHGNISGRAITNALHEMCNKILEEKKRVQEIVSKNTQVKPWSDIMNTPPPPSAKEHAGFNVKPHREQKKTFTAKFVGSTDVNKPTGMDILNRAISKVCSRGGPKRTVLIDITISSIKITDCTSQEVLAEDRVRFLSFMGIGRDDRLCGYIITNGADSYMCHVFQCAPNAGTLTKALEEACQLRYQKCLDAHPELATKVPSQDAEKTKDKDKDKGNFITSMQGLLGKLGTRKGGSKKDDISSVNSPPLPKPSHTFMVKYYGALPVAVGTGIETVQEAAKHLTGGTLLICQLDVAINGVTLYDSQRSALSRRHMDADTISYCGLTSGHSHFGLIQSQGGGKYICHVFSEYKTKSAPIVAAIHETL